MRTKMVRDRDRRTKKLELPVPERFTPYFPRAYQRKMVAAYQVEWNEERRLYLPATLTGVGVWHRGAGKGMTVTAVLQQAMAARPGNYMHAFPTYATAKKALWSESWWKAMWPARWAPVFKETELCVECSIEGQTARLWLVGADKREDVDKLRGTNPYGVVYDEAPEMEEGVRELSARLAVNGGWELLLGTPKGRTWFYRAYLSAVGRGDFYSEIITVDETFRDAVDFDGVLLPGEDGQRVVSEAAIELERAKGRSEEWIQQEFYCSFNSNLVGTIYGDRLMEARAKGRIGHVPYDANKPVGVWLDIGYDDPTAMVFYQVDGNAIRIFDYEARRGLETGETIAFLLSKPYAYGRVTLPHDAARKVSNAPDSIEWKFRQRMRCEVKVTPKPDSKQIGIDLVRAKFSRFVFDEVSCSRAPTPSLPSLLDSLGAYRYGWSADRQDNSGAPVHDANSHAADAVRTGIEGWQEGLEFFGDWEKRNPVTANCNFNVFERPGDPERVKTRERVRDWLRAA